MFTCMASTTYANKPIYFGCNKALDANTYSMWVTEEHGIGSWIEIQFKAYYSLAAIEIRKHNTEQYLGVPINNIKEMSLMFSGNINKEVILPNITYLEWHIITLTPWIISNALRISTMSVHGAEHVSVAISEINFYGITGNNLFL